MSVGITRAEHIKASIQATRERRRSQRPMVIELKLQNLSRKQEAVLNRAFL
ncbi:MAG: transposase, partial [Armatimonadota bacterium]